MAVSEVARLVTQVTLLLLETRSCHMYHATPPEAATPLEPSTVSQHSHSDLQARANYLSVHVHVQPAIPLTTCH